MVNLANIESLNAELSTAIVNFHEYHDNMRRYKDFYKNSAFYKKRSGSEKDDRFLKDNLLKVFADKNIHYTSPFPTIKVPTSGASTEERMAASIREKILYAVHQKSGTEQLQKKWAFDATVQSAAVAETYFDIKNRCPRVRRYNPEKVFWQISNDNDNTVSAFWAVWAITLDEAKQKYNVTPTRDLISHSALQNDYFNTIDGKKWFTMAIRWDGKQRVAWVGDKFIERPHEHLMGEIPIDICTPFDEGLDRGEGSFYLEQLIPLQAELNKAIKQRSNIAARMANPTIWARGLIGKQLGQVKQGLKSSTGGMVSLKQNGDLGLLQVNDVKLLDNHIADLRSEMMRISGFSNAAFGESVGANTSGDALGMYFTPTQRLIEHQYVSWKAFYQSINRKILMSIERFGQMGETFNLSGYSPRGTLTASNSGDQAYQSGVFALSFTKDVIGGNYNSVIIPKPITPKNEIEQKRLAMEMVDRKVISRATAFEEMGMLSPEDEIALLQQEQSDPLLNPEGTEKILNSAPQEELMYEQGAPGASFGQADLE